MGDDVADLRSAGMGIIPPGGHPNPTATIADTLSIRAVWRRGVRQTPA